jgi:hypothetical protein
MAFNGILSWLNPTSRSDGTVYDALTETAGYQISLDAVPAVDVPTGFATSFDLKTLAAYPSLQVGVPHTITLAIVDKGGLVSAPSAPVTFSIPAPVVAPPNPPTNLSVS